MRSTARASPAHRHDKGRDLSLLQIDREQLDSDTVVLSVKGDLDAFTVAEFRQAAARPRDSSTLIIQLGSAFVDSAGLNALIQVARQAREDNGRTAVVCTKRANEFLKPRASIGS